MDDFERDFPNLDWTFPAYKHLGKNCPCPKAWKAIYVNNCAKAVSNNNRGLNRDKKAPGNT